ncbi:50S ribosomal protein L9 [Georgenia sunbinii]|uniref:50S ribosomal protein L9 n=1 Tax=Georgenia sunbinii TaxID=3117728 RepID=UPI002F268239
MAKIILTHEVSGLGTAGDVVEVKDGYARNFLFPRGLATGWTKGAQKQIDQMRQARKKRQVATVEEARSIRDSLQSKPVVVSARSGAGGRLFGAVTTTDIAEAVKAAGGPSVDKRKIEVSSPIKSLGEHKVQIRLHEDVQATVEISVVEA